MVSLIITGCWLLSQFLSELTFVRLIITRHSYNLILSTTGTSTFVHPVSIFCTNISSTRCTSCHPLEILQSSWDWHPSTCIKALAGPAAHAQTIKHLVWRKNPCKSSFCMTDAERQECILPHRHLQQFRGFSFPFFPSGFGLQHTEPTRILDDKSYLSRMETRPLLTMATVQVLYIFASHISSRLPWGPAAFANSTFSSTNTAPAPHDRRNLFCFDHTSSSSLDSDCGVVWASDLIVTHQDRSSLLHLIHSRRTNQRDQQIHASAEEAKV